MVKFTPIVSLFFEPDLSNGTENDLITVLNIPVAVIFFFIYSVSYS